MTTQDHEELLLYWSGELDESARARIAHRLENDGDAAAYLSELQELHAEFEQFDPPVSSRPLAQEAVTRALARERIVSLPKRRLHTWSIAAAAALAVVGFAMFMIATQPEAETAHSPPNERLTEEDPAIPPEKSVSEPLSKRLFVAKPRFLKAERFKATRERVRKIRSGLPNYSI